MRMLFTFALLSATAFPCVAVAQEETSQVAEVAVEAAESLGNDQASIVDLDEPAPSDAEIDSAREATLAAEVSVVAVEGAVTMTTEYNQTLDQGVSYPESIVTQDCDCQSGVIAPVVYQSPLIEGVVEGANAVTMEGTAEAAPIADATSVVESPITDSAPVYSDSGMVTEGAPIYSDAGVITEGAPMVQGSSSCGCNQGAAPAMATEGLISSSAPAVSYQSAPAVSYQSAPAVSYQSAPVTYASPAPAAAPCCQPARRGFFRTLLGR